MDLQRNIESSTEKRTKDTYGPPMGKKLITFIDDFNMPRVDTYGTQQPLALLKTFIERYTTMLVHDSVFMEELPTPQFMHQEFSVLHPLV